MTTSYTRRRFLTVAASAGVAASLPPMAWAVPNVPVSDWRGNALGAPASMTLVHPDRELARHTINACVAEIARLESIFSLYKQGSDLVRLNTTGVLHNPPIDLLEVLSFALSLSKLSNGHFDPTIQPLYNTIAKHFSVANASAQGPSQSDIAKSLKLVDYSSVVLNSDRISFKQAGMALTLNGVAQGYITDKIAYVLNSAGFTDILIDIGEIRASGMRADGTGWTAGVAHPQQPDNSVINIPIGSSADLLPALATSSGAGSKFSQTGGVHHLLNPFSGASANHFELVSVAANKAMIADGLSTAISIIGAEQANTLISAWSPAQAWLLNSDKSISTINV